MVKSCGFYSSFPDIMHRPLRVSLSRMVVSLSTKKIHKVALWVFPLLLSMPLYFMGSLVGLFTVKINRKNLSLAPPKIILPQETEACDSINALLELGVNDYLRKESNPLYKDGYLFYNEDEREAVRQASLYLRCICKKIENGKVSDKLRDKIRREMNEALQECKPTWSEVAIACYAEVQGCTVREETLRHIQEYKEDLIKEIVQIDFNKTEWHGLNYMREKIGKERGLDPSRASADYNNNGEIFPRLSGFVCKLLFFTKYYDTERLINAIQNRINAKIDQDGYPYAYKFFDYVRNQYCSSNPKIDVETAIEYVGGTFFDEELRINKAGAIYLLQTIGILT